MSVNRIGGLLLSRGLGNAVLTALPEVASLPRQTFPVGSRVRIKQGVFEGVQGRLISYGPASRLLIAVDLNCPGVSIEIDARMVEALNG
jgi:transcription antitermination factor NusG